MRKNKLKAVEAAMLIALCAALCVGTWAQGRQNAISGQLVRLHVIAASDDAREQALKLRVRDAVLEYLTPLLDGADGSAEAKRRISENLDGIARAAAERADGRGITVMLGREKYPTRRYSGFALPAGEYDSLRVVLGAGEGHNWWCVVFPPLCTSSVQSDEIRAAMSTEELAIITESDGYELRFRTVELWGEIKALLDGAGD